MKRFLTILLTTLALTAALCITASASNFDGAAKDLATIGMFRGTSDGFALDNIPTRGQAAIMLVRLYGAEEAAQNTFRSGRITCPFTDVNETVAPYVAWLADEGLTNGTSPTTFGASQPCTARAYTIFLLRALGYRDGTDFTTSTAQEFAAGLGIIDTSAITGTFRRDDLAAMTYQALGVDLRDGSTYLLDKLIQDGVIEANRSYAISNKITKLRELDKASEDMEKALSAGLELDMDITVSAAGNAAGQDLSRIERSRITGKGDFQVILGRQPQMAFNLNLTVDGKDTPVQVWLRGDSIYVKSEDGSVRTVLPDEYLEALSSVSSPSTSVGIMPFLEDITVKTDKNESVYTLEFNDAFAGMLNSAIVMALKESGLPEGVMGEIKFNGITMNYTVKDGKLKDVNLDSAFSVILDMNMGQGAQLNMTVGVIMEMGMDVKATGSSVKITFPDFSGFETVDWNQAVASEDDASLGIIGGADGPTAVVVSAIV